MAHLDEAMKRRENSWGMRTRQTKTVWEQHILGRYREKVKKKGNGTNVSSSETAATLALWMLAGIVWEDTLNKDDRNSQMFNYKHDFFFYAFSMAVHLHNRVLKNATFKNGLHSACFQKQCHLPSPCKLPFFFFFLWKRWHHAPHITSSRLSFSNAYVCRCIVFVYTVTSPPTGLACIKQHFQLIRVNGDR